MTINFGGQTVKLPNMPAYLQTPAGVAALQQAGPNWTPGPKDIGRIGDSRPPEAQITTQTTTGVTPTSATPAPMTVPTPVPSPTAAPSYPGSPGVGTPTPVQTTPASPYTTSPYKKVPV